MSFNGTVSRIVWYICIAVTAFTGRVACQEVSGRMYSAEELKWVFNRVEKLDPTKRHLFQNLQQLSGNRSEYAEEDVKGILGMLPKIQGSYEHPSPAVPTRIDAIPKQDAVRLLRFLNGLSPKKSKAQILAELEAQFKNKSKEDVIRALAETKESASDPEADLIKKFDNKPYYLPSEVRDVQANGPKLAMEDAPFPIPPPSGTWGPILYGLAHPLIRQSWSDVLSAEDLSQTGKAKIGDLVGATFSFANDARSRTETWTAIGTLIVPFDYKLLPVRGGWSPDEFMVAPSLSIDRVSTSHDTKTEPNQVLFRMGLFSDWEESYGALQLRGAFVYGTDTGFRTSMPAFEAELEPQLIWRPEVNAQTGKTDFATTYLKIGYKNILIPKTPALKDQSDNSLLDYQLRVYLHTEGGSLEDAGTTFNTVNGSFLRIGPEVQLRVNAPKLVFDRPLSFTGSYSYLPAITGTSQHDSLLTLNLTLGLLPVNPPGDTSLQQKISLNLGYTEGGLDFTKQKVRQYTLGLSVLY
jgi:hypothetical protein